MTTEKTLPLAPIVLGPNQPTARPYRGGAGIRELRGTGSTDDHTPEDFVGSTTTVFGSDDVGLTTLPDGRILRDAIAADPDGFLGAAHVARHGADPALLVKLLSTGERLFNHVHPDGAFAAEHLGLTRGKTESWLITSTGDREAGDVWLGFRRDVEPRELADWFDRQATDTMLDALHHLRVRAGDWVHVPAGMPHSIGPDITLVELQEPTDLSIILELDGFPGIDPAGALLGLDPATALGAVTTMATSAEALRALHGSATDAAHERLLPDAARAFHRAERFAVDGVQELPAGYAILVVLDGSGTLDWSGGSVPLDRGATVLIPFGVGPTALHGTLVALRCTPPGDTTT